MSGDHAGARRGFTLLEVLVAIAILGLGLTVILSSQTGLFSSATRAERLTAAGGLLRCRMSEIEAELLRDGYALTDIHDAGRCCDDDDLVRGYRCEWWIERVLLPNAPTTGPFDSAEEEEPTSAPGPLAALAAVGETEGAVLGPNADIGSVAQLMGGSMGGGSMGGAMGGLMGSAMMGGSQSMAPMVMGLVYPSLKPMLEASIRKVTVTVRWMEGKADRELTATQYLTNPQQGGLMDPSGMGMPGMGMPGMGAPGMGAPGMGAPGMGAPGMGAPGMGAPGMGGRAVPGRPGPGGRLR